MKFACTTSLTYLLPRLALVLFFALGIGHPKISGISNIEAQVPNDAEWLDKFSFNPGCNGVIRTAVTDVDGTIYAGGQFTMCGSSAARNIARYDPSTGRWSALGEGINTSDFPQQGIFALAIYEGNLIAGGRFTSAGRANASNLAYWNGQQWTEFNGGANGAVNALLAANSVLYVGGSFGQIGNVSTPFAAQFSNNQWQPLDSVSSSYSLAGPVVDIAIANRELYFAAEFSIEDELRRDYLARWDGSDWHSLGAGVNGEVLSISEHAGQLIAAGAFTSAGNASTQGVAIWNGVIWNVLSCGTPSSGNGQPRDLLSINGDLFLGVTRSTAGPEASLWRWRSSQCEFIAGFDADDRFANIHSLAVSGGIIYALGQLDPANIATYDGVEVGIPSPGDGKGLFRQFSGNVNAIEITPLGTFVAGSFDKAGQISASNIAQWLGSSWKPLETAEGEGVNSGVNSLQWYQGDLYVGGAFSQAGGVPARAIARWDGTEFHELPGPPGDISSVTAMEEFNRELIVAPEYFPEPLITGASIVRWNGSAWLPFADVWNGDYRGWISDILVLGPSLYIAGRFDQVMGIPANNVAYFSNGDWQALGTGLQHSDSLGASVSSLHWRDGLLFVGGRFDLAGSHVTYNFAAWDGTSWIPEISGTSFASNSSVNSMASDDNCLYVGGLFRQMGELVVDNLACLSSDLTWSRVLNGVDGRVNSLLTTEIDSLWVGGSFSRAPPTYASNIAFLDGPELVFHSGFEN